MQPWQQAQIASQQAQIAAQQAQQIQQQQTMLNAHRAARQQADWHTATSRNRRTRPTSTFGRIIGTVFSLIFVVIALVVFAAIVFVAYSASTNISP
jgi:hypothetical protein